jgi:hypothetical protein
MGVEESQALGKEILEGGKPANGGIIEGLQEVDNGGDFKERLLLHMLATQTCAPERVGEQKMLGEAYLEALAADRPAPVKVFLVQQLRLFADGSAAPHLAPFLHDEDPQLVDAAAATMVSIGREARNSLEEAKQGAGVHGKAAIEHALRQIG